MKILCILILFIFLGPILSHAADYEECKCTVSTDYITQVFAGNAEITIRVNGVVGGVEDHSGSQFGEGLTNPDDGSPYFDFPGATIEIAETFCPPYFENFMRERGSCRSFLIEGPDSETGEIIQKPFSL